MQGFLITDPIVARRTGWKDIPAEIRQHVYAYASARERVTWQRTCRRMAFDLPGSHLPAAFAAVYHEGNWIHKELIILVLKQGPRWFEQIPVVEIRGYSEIFLAFRIRCLFRQYACHINVYMTLNPEPIRYFSTTLHPPHPKGVNIKWNFSWMSERQSVSAWNWADIEKQLPCIPWKAIHREPVIEEFYQNLVFARATLGAVPGNNMDVILPVYVG